LISLDDEFAGGIFRGAHHQEVRCSPAAEGKLLEPHGVDNVVL
jgi:hypothetical protein